jgi:YD repeat-containing protein
MRLDVVRNNNQLAANVSQLVKLSPSKKPQATSRTQPSLMPVTNATGLWDLFTASLDGRYQVTHIQYEYDPLYRLVRAEYEGDFNGEYRYAYDAVGNRTAYTTTITSTTVIA